MNYSTNDIANSKEFGDGFVKNWPMIKVGLNILAKSLNNFIARKIIYMAVLIGEAVYNSIKR